jgi:hypothetical protein
VNDKRVHTKKILKRYLEFKVKTINDGIEGVIETYSMYYTGREITVKKERKIWK